MKRRILQTIAATAASAVVFAAAPAVSVAVAAEPAQHAQVKDATASRHTPTGNHHKPKHHKPKHHDKGAVTGRAIYRHLVQFQNVADANKGTRAAGTPGYEASAKYVEKKLRKAGYKPVRQYFDAQTYEVLDLAVTVPGVTLDPIAMEFSSSTPDAGVNAALVAPSDPLGCDAAAYTGVDVSDKIVVASRGTCSFAAKAAAAGTAGAAALIIYNNVEGPLNGTLGGPNPDSAPAVGVTQAEGQALVAAIATGATGTFDLQGVTKTVKTFNVLAETKRGSADNVVMLGAHLDSVPEGPGINDNGSGSAGILETAIQLAEQGANSSSHHGNKHHWKQHHGKKHGHHSEVAKQFKNKVRFAWWGAEESGLQGSNHYVENLAQADLDKLAVYLNFDMIGSPNYMIGVYDADESTFPAPVEVPPGSAAAEAKFTDYFDSIGQPWVDTEFSGRSDYQAFILNGVPATGLFTGAEQPKTAAEVALFGGTEGVAYDPNYHTAGDDLSNVSRKALDINGRAIGKVTFDLARSTKAINGG